MKIFGLIGKSLKHSYSKEFFTKKFRELNLTDHRYLLFELNDVNEFQKLIESDPSLIGLNVTIPFKEKILTRLNFLDNRSKDVGAVNTIKIKRDNNKITTHGYNTDVIGFQNSISNHLKDSDRFSALVLGNGGSSKAVQFVLKSMKISHKVVARNPKNEQLHFNDVDSTVIKDHHLIINTTPLGMFPNLNAHPPLPFEFISPDHLIFDLIYNPNRTLLMEKAAEKGATVVNGIEMLHEQAKASWKIWNEV